MEEPTDADGSADFIAFVRDNRHRLLQLATLLTGDVHAGEDVLQSALEKTYLRWLKGHRPQRLDAYVRTALANEARSRRRRWSFRHESSTARPPETAHAGHDDGVSTRLSILAALGRLPARQRAVIVLRYFDDLSEADVAAVIGCSVGTVKTHNHRGLKTLRNDPHMAAQLGDMEVSWPTS